MTKILKIEYIGEEEQQCIMVDSPDHLYLTDNEIVSHNTIVGGVLSELAFFREAGRPDSYIMKIYNNLKERVESRMKGNYFGRTILDSSPNDIDSPIDYYCWYEAEKNPLNLVCKGGRWQWAPEDFKDITEKFPVYMGGNGKVPEVLDVTTKVDPTEIVWVPKDPILFNLFKNDTVNALKNIAGIPQGAVDRIFPNFEKIENIFIPTMKNMYSFIVVNESERPEEFIWNIIAKDFFVKEEKGYKFYYKPYLPRVISFDQSISGDITGIAMSHVEMQLSDTNILEPIYIIDFTIAIAPMGGRINLDAIKLFVTDLVYKGNISLAKITFDHFESEASIQYIKRMLGKDSIEKLSVDIEMGPYLSFTQLINQERVKVGRNIFLKNNLKSLRITKRKRSETQKVDHTAGDTGDLTGDLSWESSLVGYNAKDISDACCASIEACRLYLVDKTTELFNEDEITLTPEQKLAKVNSLLKKMGLQIK